MYIEIVAIGQVAQDIYIYIYIYIYTYRVDLCDYVCISIHAKSIFRLLKCILYTYVDQLSLNTHDATIIVIRI